MIEIKRYKNEDFSIWNSFIAESKNGVFIFNRRFMEYHSDRYEDFSLIAFKKGNVIAVLPANIESDKVMSHGGLTYGGWVMGEEMTLLDMRETFLATKEFLKINGISSLLYKVVPSVFHRMPAQEDLYCLHDIGAVLVRRDVSTVLKMDAVKNYSSQRKRNIKKAVKNNLSVEESMEYREYYVILSEALKFHNAKPVHSVSEMLHLADEFPQNIRLFVAKFDGRIVAGTVVFINTNIAHTQYLASSPIGRDMGALDLVLDHLITEVFCDKAYLSFGISTEQDGRFVNEGLISQKEGFGGRASVNDFYSLNI